MPQECLRLHNSMSCRTCLRAKLPVRATCQKGKHKVSTDIEYSSYTPMATVTPSLKIHRHGVAKKEVFFLQ